MDETQDTRPAPTADTPKVLNIHQAITAVMAEVGGVGKTRKNVQQGYNFRGIADVYLACQPIMAKHGMHVCPEQLLAYNLDELQTKSGSQMWRVRVQVRFRAWSTDGSYVDVATLGEAMDTGDKASNKAMSAAMKYCLVQLFALPEEDPTVDTETSSPETVATRPPVDTAKAEHVAKVVALGEALKAAGRATADWKPWMAKVLGKPVPNSDALSMADLDKLTKALADEVAK